MTRSAAAAARNREYMHDYARRPEIQAHKAAYDRARRQGPSGDAKRARNRDYVRSHADQLRARKTAWYQANRERIAERGRLRRNPLANREHVRRWREERPMAAAASSAAKRANRVAAIFEAQGRLSMQGVLNLWQREPECVDCGDGRGLDHVIPLSRGGSNTTGNLANRCQRCNSRKGRRTPAEMAA